MKAKFLAALHAASLLGAVLTISLLLFPLAASSDYQAAGVIEKSGQLSAR
ncbi:MAG: hypothetical protein GWP58_14070, partial [Gammaproteobacteria bacterium]|nr:hypothetical protein [Gammaproteobacteria bacterium]